MTVSLAFISKRRYGFLLFSLNITYYKFIYSEKDLNKLPVKNFVFGS